MTNLHKDANQDLSLIRARQKEMTATVDELKRRQFSKVQPAAQIMIDAAHEQGHPSVDTTADMSKATSLICYNKLTSPISIDTRMLCQEDIMHKKKRVWRGNLYRRG